MTGLVSKGHGSTSGLRTLTDNAGIITKQETSSTDEEAEEISSEGSEPCSIESAHRSINRALNARRSTIRMRKKGDLHQERMPKEEENKKKVNLRKKVARSTS